MAPTEILSFNNPVFSSFVFYTTIVLLKMMVMSILTAYKRISSGTFVAQEDVDAFKGKGKGKPVFGNESVEKVRRNHLNDMENIPPFVMLGLLYVLSQPSPFTAILHFRIFAASRILHTICYQLAIPQPARGLTFGIGLAICVSMAVQLLSKASW